jgi:subtilisin family serine protease
MRHAFLALSILCLFALAAQAAEFTPGVLLAIAEDPAAFGSTADGARPAAADPALAALLAAQGIERVDYLVAKAPAAMGARERRYLRLEGAASLDVLAAREALAASGRFRAVSPDWYLQFLVLPNDPMLGTQWHITNGTAGIHLPEAWDNQQGDAGSVIAIIDTGVDWSHPDLGPNMWQNPDETDGNGIDDDGNGWVDDRYGWDCAANDNDPRPQSYVEGGIDVGFHGSHCAGIAAAATDNAVGVAGAGWDCRLMALKVVGTGTPFSVAAITMAFDYAISEGADVISMSFGGTISDFGFMQALVDDASAAGIICVAAAGNNNTSAMMYPAALDRVISVAATNSANQRASFSTYGTWVDVAAPGEQIWSTIMTNYTLDFLTELLFMFLYGYDGVNPYMYSDGTSMACPLVAGVVGLVKSGAPWMDHDAMVQHLIDTGDNVVYDQPCGVKVNAAQAVATLTAAEAVAAAGRLAAWPNPFNPTVTLRFALPAAGQVRLAVYDAAGREVALLLDGERPAGEQLITWRAEGLASGVYLARLEGPGVASAEKLVLLR